MAALDVVSQLSTKQLCDVCDVPRGVRDNHFPLQHIEEQTAELLDILLNLCIFLRPSEGPDQFLWRNCLFFLHHPVEQHLQGGWKFVSFFAFCSED